MIPELVVDPAIRTWVVFPILIVMILAGLIRHYAMGLLAPQMTPPTDAAELKEQSWLSYSACLAQNHSNVPIESYSYVCSSVCEQLRSGTLVAQPQSKNPGMPDLSDPKGTEKMFAALRGQILTYVPQTVLMSWVSAFFGGYVVLRLPFRLTLRFKQMVQQGVQTQDLDVHWASSVSLYLVLLIGLSSVYNLILGSNNMAGNQAQGQMGPGGMGVPQMAPNVDKRRVCMEYADTLELVEHKSVFSGIEKRVAKLKV